MLFVAEEIQARLVCIECLLLLQKSSHLSFNTHKGRKKIKSWPDWLSVAT